MSKFIGYENVTFDETEAADIHFGIPSVMRGPVDISKVPHQGFPREYVKMLFPYLNESLFFLINNNK